MKVSGEKKDFLKIHKVGDAEGEVVYVVKLDVRIIIRLLLVSIINKIKSCSKLHDWHRPWVKDIDLSFNEVVFIINLLETHNGIANSKKQRQVDC